MGHIFTGVHKNQAFTFSIGLTSQADVKLLQVNPTIAAGDFKVSIDGGAFADLTNLPAVTPAGGRAVKFIMTAAQMNGDYIFIQSVDAAGSEWCDDWISISTIPNDASLTQIDGTALVSATLNLKKISVVNTTGDAFVATSSGSNGHGIVATGNGTGSGIVGQGGLTGHGLFGQAGATSGNGILGYGGVGNGNGFLAQGAATGGYGIYALAGATGNYGGLTCQGNGSGSGINGTGGLTGDGILAVGGATSGNGLRINAQTNGNGIYATGVGTGNSGIIAAGGTNGSGGVFLGTGSGQGIIANGGVTGNGIAGIGGATSGAGLYTSAIGGGTGITAIGVGTVSVLATQGISGPLDTSEKTSIADALLKRDMSAVTGEASRSPLNCFRAIRNKWSFSGNTYTVTKEDNTTPAWTSTVTTNAAAEPVISFTGNQMAGFFGVLALWVGGVARIVRTSGGYRKATITRVYNRVAAITSQLP